MGFQDVRAAVRADLDPASILHTDGAQFYKGMMHISPAHLPRYLNEFDFRMNNRAKLGVNDDVRAQRILKGAEGKRLTYRQVG